MKDDKYRLKEGSNGVKPFSDRAKGGLDEVKNRSDSRRDVPERGKGSQGRSWGV
jgi:hypothetical protein